MTAPAIAIQLDRAEPFYRPGESLTGSYRIDLADPNELKAIELSVLWHTMGKGDEDLAVHYFQRATPDDEEPLELSRPQPFASELPNSPLSYDGLIVKICWQLRVRLFLKRGREAVAEQPFTLGEIPPPSMANDTENEPGDAAQA
jgi:hypothetical protein